MVKLRNWVAHPLTRGLDIDDPRTTELRGRIIQEKRFLRRIYQEWYIGIASALPTGAAPILEIGSGGGFLRDFIPGLITSEIFYCPGIKIILDGQQLPFARGSLRAIVMTNVLHHLPEVRHFFRDASRCVRAGGVIVMIEPWVTGWSSVIYRRLHHEPFCPEAAKWQFPSGALSDANGALAWMIFERDRSQFLKEFHQWKILSIRPCMPFRYLVSGGVSMRSFMPAWAFDLWRGLENALSPWIKDLAMFAQIVLQRAG